MFFMVGADKMNEFIDGFILGGIIGLTLCSIAYWIYMLIEVNNETI